MSWLSTGAGIGVAVGATIVGRVIDGHGARVAFTVPAVAGLFAVMVALLVAMRPGSASVSVPDARMTE